MQRAERALQVLRLQLEREAVRLAAALAVGEQHAATRRRDELAGRRDDWQAALRGGLAAAALDPGRLLELERGRRAAHGALERARLEAEALQRQEAVARGGFARLRHRERGLRRAARALEAAGRVRREEAAAREAEDAWSARRSGAHP